MMLTINVKAAAELENTSVQSCVDYLRIKNIIKSSFEYQDPLMPLEMILENCHTKFLRKIYFTNQGTLSTVV